MPRDTVEAPQSQRCVGDRLHDAPISTPPAEPSKRRVAPEGRGLSGRRAATRRSDPSNPPLAGVTRLALRPREAAAALGLSERKLRMELRRIPHVRLGGAVLFPVDSLRRWLDAQAKSQATVVDEAVHEVLDSLVPVNSP